MKHAISTLMLTGAMLASTCLAEEPLTRVTVSNFIRAETDRYFFDKVQEGGFGRLAHQRELASIDQQTVVRTNRDTLYSSGVFDLQAGAVTVTLPDAGARFMSMQVVSQDHYTTEVVYSPGRHRYSKDNIGTRYVFLLVRTLVDPNDSSDMKAARQLQDRIGVEQAATGAFQVPHWDEKSQGQVRDALLVLGTMLDRGVEMFGRKDDVDPVYHLIGTATGWGGNPRSAAVYESTYPSAADGKVVHAIRLRDVPVDGFWSISVYNAKGYFEKNALNAYSLNSLTARRGADGAVRVQFGGCEARIANCLPIMRGWNYTVRMYRPRAQILEGTWKFPVAQPVK